MSISFTKNDFNVFTIDGLEERMTAIQGTIQPKFNEIGSVLCDDLAILTGNEMFLHIAKHARRTVNPPKDTWLAISHNRRGYKKHPHFQVGLFDDRVFIWFALIYELPNKKEIAANLLQHIDELYSIIPKDYVLSSDHMKKTAIQVSQLNKADFKQQLLHFHDVKKAELLIGRHIAATDPLLQNSSALLELIRETMKQLLPFYKHSFF